MSYLNSLIFWTMIPFGLSLSLNETSMILWLPRPHVRGPPKLTQIHPHATHQTQKCVNFLCCSWMFFFLLFIDVLIDFNHLTHFIFVFSTCTQIFIYSNNRPVVPNLESARKIYFILHTILLFFQTSFAFYLINYLFFLASRNKTRMVNLVITHEHLQPTTKIGYKETLLCFKGSQTKVSNVKMM